MCNYRCAQAARLDREGQDLLQGVVRASLKKLDYDDLPTEEKLLKAGSLRYCATKYQLVSLSIHMYTYIYIHI